jgi:predicted alpha/beta hydrolase family esterase
MKKAFIIHGIEGHSKENWFPWLKQELEKEGYEVIVPDFPNSGNPKLNEWINHFSKYKLDANSIIISHSLGVPFTLTLLEKHKAKTTFLVAGFTGALNNDFDARMNTIAQRKFNWEKINQNCKSFYLFYSDNDPYVPIEKAEELAKKLGIDPILIKNAGHFNESAGYTKFPILLEKILSF